MPGHNIRYALRLTTKAQGMPAHRPWTTAGVLIAAACAASYLPTRRTTQTSPADMMRSER